MSFDARQLQATVAAAERIAPHAHFATAKVAPHVLGKIGEAFATSLWALQQRLARLGPLAEPQQATLDAASATVERLEQLGIQLQELARVLAGDGSTVPEPVDLAAALGQSVAEWAPVAARRGVRLEGSAATSEALEVQLAAGVVEQLLDLAIDHALRIGLQVEVAASMQGQPPRPMLTVQVQRSAAAAQDCDAIDEVHWLLFTVLARGCGLAPQRVATEHSVVLMLSFPGHEELVDGPMSSAALLPRTPIAADRQVLVLEPRELPRVQAHRLMHDAGMQVDAVATLEQARAALRDRTPDVFVTGLAPDAGACGALIDELRALQPRLRIIELVDDDSAFALSLPGVGNAGRVGRSDLARTLVSAVSQELDSAWAGLQ